MLYSQSFFYLVHWGWIESRHNSTKMNKNEYNFEQKLNRWILRFSMMTTNLRKINISLWDNCQHTCVYLKIYYAAGI